MDVLYQRRIHLLHRITWSKPSLHLDCNVNIIKSPNRLDILEMDVLLKQNVRVFLIHSLLAFSYLPPSKE